MMEPRWNSRWNDGQLRFVGGLNECDLWLNYHTTGKHKGKISSVRIVRGDGIDDWTFVWWTSNGIRQVCPSDVVTGFNVLIDRHKEDINAYLRLFVPELDGAG